MSGRCAKKAHNCTVRPAIKTRVKWYETLQSKLGFGLQVKKTMVSFTDKHKSQPALRGEDNDRSKPSGDSAQILSLSLFIMLLAFFIVLNAISSFDEQRVNPAIQSIEQTFQTKIEPRGGRQAATETVHDTLMRGSAFDRVKALFRAELPSFRVVQRDGNSLYVLRVRVFSGPP